MKVGYSDPVARWAEDRAVAREAADRLPVVVDPVAADPVAEDRHPMEVRGVRAVLAGRPLVGRGALAPWHSATGAETRATCTC